MGDIDSVPVAANTTVLPVLPNPEQPLFVVYVFASPAITEKARGSLTPAAKVEEGCINNPLDPFPPLAVKFATSKVRSVSRLTVPDKIPVPTEQVGASIKIEEALQLAMSYKNVPLAFELEKKLLHELVGPVVPEGTSRVWMELICGGVGKFGILGAVALVGW